MDTVLRALVTYVALLVIFRIAGRRTLSHMTTFDLVLTLIISEAVQQGMVDDDHSMTAALLLVITLVGADIFVSVVKFHWNIAEKVVDGSPILLVQDGKLHMERLTKERIDVGDILSAARERHGLERFSQIKHAILEKSGEISIVPKAQAA
jgi:uncharacterized membrane protein YcaP (DUF421 family)